MCVTATRPACGPDVIRTSPTYADLFRSEGRQTSTPSSSGPKSSNGIVSFFAGVAFVDVLRFLFVIVVVVLVASLFAVVAFDAFEAIPALAAAFDDDDERVTRRVDDIIINDDVCLVNNRKQQPAMTIVRHRLPSVMINYLLPSASHVCCPDTEVRNDSR